MTIKAAQAYIRQHHRHHKPPQGGLFAVGVRRRSDGVFCGVAVVGRPCRMLQDGFTAEVTRVATDGTPNACSILYQAAKRAAQQLGYRRVITYLLAEETGASLRGAGWVQATLPDGSPVQSKGGQWSRPSRPRTDEHPTGPKQRWEAV